MDDNINYNSDEDISEKNHSRLLEAVTNLDKTQRIKKPTRSEPSLQISEYNLVKPGANAKSTVRLNKLLKVLNNKSSHTEALKKLKNVRRKVKTLPKPLEKPQERRIKRSVGFTNVKKSLNRWESIVYANRAAEQIKFPLNQPIQLKLEPTERLKSRFRIKSELELKLEQLNPVSEQSTNDKDQVPLTLKEILKRRKEMAKLRAQQSYNEAKARRQNKIKSKKYHRIQRREKVKQQLKEFEFLQKHDPEQALKKLDEIERVRAEERMSLRHRSTGQWARNKQIRSKFDKDSRQLLAQQLAVSRDLTQKLQTYENSSDEEEPKNTNVAQLEVNSKNPWVNQNAKTSEVDDFFSGYRKYWNEKNKHDDLQKQASNNSKDDIKTLKEQDEKSEEPKPKLDNNTSITINDNVKHPIKVKKSKKLVKTKNVNTVVSTNEWIVENINEKSINVDEIFANLDNELENKIKTKLNKLKTNKNTELKIKECKKSKKAKYKSDLSLKSERPMRPAIDENLTSDPIIENKPKNSTTVNLNKNETTNIDTNTFNEIKPTYLGNKSEHINHVDGALDDDLDEMDHEIDENQLNYLNEAFEDDNFTDDFRKEKQKEIDGDTPKDIDLSLPGWGSWGGTNIKKRKKSRFIIKMPKKLPRKDDNKGDLIIKEFKNKKIEQHQVSEVPFPFQSVDDFEKSIRAPIGNTFIPETAHRRLIKPAVVTRTGSIIEPMDEEEIIKNHIKKLRKRS